MDIRKLISKVLGISEKEVKNVEEMTDRNRISKHVNGRKRPANFSQKRKIRRKMAKASRRINRKS